MTRRPTISVVGPGAAGPELEALAFAVGREIARAGAILVTGGLGGVMAAASRGAASAGGLTVGVLPGTRHDSADSHVQVALPTGIGEARNLIVALAGQAVIAVGGALGTLSEIALALKNGRPVIGLDTWDLDPVRAGGPGIRRAGDPIEAVRLALQAARGSDDRP